MWSDQFDVVGGGEMLVQAIAIVGFVADQTLRELFEETRGERGVDEGDFMRPKRWATWTATGRPWRSPIAMILLPLPRRVGPTAEPLFSPR
jgi:hypothetical protein